VASKISIKSDTAFDTILIFWSKSEPKIAKGRTFEISNGNENQSIESMRKYENQSGQKFKKALVFDLGNRCSIHLSYGGDSFVKTKIPSPPRMASATHPAMNPLLILG
jgi:hypothetical protein